MATQREMRTEDYIRILRHRWPMIAVLAVAGTLLGFIASAVLPKKFTSQTLVIVEQPAVPADIVKPVISTDMDQRLAAMQSQILSRSRLEPIIQQLGLYRNEVNRVPMEDLVARLRKAIAITPIKPMEETRSNSLPGFTVGVTFDNAYLAQQICSAITSMFLEQNAQLQQEQAQETTDFLGNQLADAKGKLDAQDSKLAAFKRQYLGSLPDDEQTNLNLLMGLTSQLDAATQALARAQQDKSFAESVLTQQQYAWQASQTGQNPDTLDQQLAVLQNQLSELQARYTDDYPDVVKAKSDIAALKNKIAETQNQKGGAPEKAARTAGEPLQIQQLRAQVHQYDQMIKDKTVQEQQIQNQIRLYQARVQSSPAVEQEYKELTRDYQTALDFYNDLLKKRDQSAMASDLQRRQEGEQFRVLDPANLPDKPSFPNKLLFTLGGLAGGLAIGIGIVFLIEMQDTSLRSERDVETMLRLPVLAMVPEIQPLGSSHRPIPANAPSLRAQIEMGTKV